MGQHEVGAVVLEVPAHQVALDARATGDGDLHRAVLIEDLEVRNGGVAVVLRDLVMLGSRGALAGVGGVALDDRAVDLVHKIRDQLGAQIVAGGRLTGGELHGHGADRLPVERLIDFDKPLGGDVVGKVDDGLFRLVRIGPHGAENAEDEEQDEQQGQGFLHV